MQELIAKLSNALSYVTPTVMFAVLVLFGCACFFIYYWYAMRPRKNSLEWISMSENRPRRLSFSGRRHPMEKKDALPLLLITALYAATAFFRLGDTQAVQSFARFEKDTTVLISFDQPTDVASVRFYTGICDGSYTLEYSPDGVVWTSLTLDQGYDKLLKWHELQETCTDENGQERTRSVAFRALLLRLSASPRHSTAHPEQNYLDLGELAFFDAQGARIPAVCGDGAGQALFDEQELVPDYSFWTNSAYFDEIYHPRTAQEHRLNIYPYEISHPPLGKLIIALGIELFGLTPFGWRFMGTLFGVLMLPILYVFLKNMFGKTPVAVCGTTLFAADFMHLTQTRIATIDSYGVFFILAMYFFMYRWLTLPADIPLRKSVPSLFLCGLMWAIGVACKWIVIYGGVGLAILWVIGMVLKCREWSPGARPRYAPFFWGTAALSVLFFIVMPLIVYTLSYFPYAVAMGNEAGFWGMVGQSLSWPFEKLPEYLKTLPDYMARLAGSAEEGKKTSGIAFTADSFFKQIPYDSADPVDILLKNQHYMFTYHEGVHTPHPYSSRWYQWIVDGRPILYFRDLEHVPGSRALFAAFNNPAVSWAGLLCVIGTAIETFRRKSAAALFITLGYLSQLVPWMFIGRITFAYHYFPSVLFLVLAISFAMDGLLERRKGPYRLAVYGLTGLSVGLYAAFYPVLIGLYVPNWYTRCFLQWLPSWPL